MVTSNIGCTTGEVNVYDSLHIVISTAMQMLLKKVLGSAKITCINKDVLGYQCIDRDIIEYTKGHGLL